MVSRPLLKWGAAGGKCFSNISRYKHERTCFSGTVKLFSWFLRVRPSRFIDRIVSVSLVLLHSSVRIFYKQLGLRLLIGWNWLQFLPPLHDSIPDITKHHLYSRKKLLSATLLLYSSGNSDVLGRIRSDVLGRIFCPRRLFCPRRQMVMNATTTLYLLHELGNLRSSFATAASPPPPPLPRRCFGILLISVGRKV